MRITRSSPTAVVGLLVLLHAPRLLADPSFSLSFQGPTSLQSPAGTTVRLPVRVVLGASGVAGPDGAQAWSISLGIEGGRLTGATTDGTVAATRDDEPPGLRAPGGDGFELSELTTGLLNTGAVSAVVLSLADPAALSPDEEHVVLELEVEVEFPASGKSQARLFFVDGRQGSGRPVRNEVTHGERPYRPTLDDLTIALEAVERPTVNGFSPARASYLGKTPCVITGTGFTDTTLFTLTGALPAFAVNLESVVRVSANEVRAVIPAHPAFASDQLADLRVSSGGELELILEDALRYAGPLELIDVTPSTFVAERGGTITITGKGFTPETRAAVGGEILAVAFVDATTLTATVPGLAAGDYNLVVADTLGATEHRGRLLGALRYLDQSDPCRDVPLDLEASLADGTARFTWANPVEYDEIDIVGGDNQVIASLPGDSTSYEFPSSSARRVKIVGRQSDGGDGEGLFISSWLEANVYPCATSDPLTGVRARSKSLSLPLRGGGLIKSVVRCTAGQGAGAGVVPDDVDGAGAGAGVRLADGGVGVISPHVDVSKRENFPLVTGFTLERPVDKLEIAAFHKKMVTELGLELRGRLRRVFPASDFEDEFTFPDNRIGEAGWRSVVYFRGTRDVSDPAAEPCGLMIPEGDYVLELYAVGGDSRRTYYLFENDTRPDQILIPGVPCPPYPLVRITDLTGLASLPRVEELEISAQRDDANGLAGFCLTANGTWLDGDNNRFRTSPYCEGEACAAEYRENSRFRWNWTMHARNGTTKTWQTTGRAVITILRSQFADLDYGCYKVDLEVVDTACGRSVTSSHEIILLPPNPRCGRSRLSFQYPKPTPNTVKAMIGLGPNVGRGEMAMDRPFRFRVLVVPDCWCSSPDSCPAPSVNDLEFRLWWFEGRAPIEARSGVDVFTVSDEECENRASGPRWFEVTIPDLNTLRFPTPPLRALGSQSILVQARPRGEIPWQFLGRMLVWNRPEVLTRAHWSGTFEPDGQIYLFDIHSDEDPLSEADIGASREIPLGIAGLKIPSYDNNLQSGFTGCLRFQNGSLDAADGVAEFAGDVVGNQVAGQPLRIEPSGPSGNGGGASLSPFEWCEKAEILNTSFEQKLFESVLYSGTIGPIPLTVFASVSLGFKATIEALIRVKVAPYEALQGGDFVSTKMGLVSTVDLHLAASIRADILFGVASLTLSLIPKMNVFLDFYLSTLDTSASVDYYADARFSLDMKIKACLLWFLCYSRTINLVKNAEMIPSSGTCMRGDFKGCDSNSPKCPSHSDGAGAGVPVLPEFEPEASRAAVAASPSGQVAACAFTDANGETYVAVEGVGPGQPGETELLPGVWPYRDFAIEFVTENVALVACTESRISDVPEASLSGLTEVERSNLLARQDEPVVFAIRVEPLDLSCTGGCVTVEHGFPLSGDDAVIYSNRHPDGMTALAVDRIAEEAWTAWVRYEDRDILKQDGTANITVLVPGENGWEPRGVPNFQPQLDKTAIHVRRIDELGPLSTSPSTKISPPGINIEPALATSPSGDVTYCVWVHDGTHKDLIKSNRGRSLLFSVHSKSSGDFTTWSAPRSVLESVADHDAKYPGVLDPNMVLRDDRNGVLTFTAVRSGSPERDTGLTGANRLVYIVYLKDGVFLEPRVLTAPCMTDVVGWNPVFAYLPVGGSQGNSVWSTRLPEYVLTFQRSGPIGTRAGAGNVSISAITDSSFTAPLDVTADNNLHSNVSGAIFNGGVRTLNYNGGSSLVSEVIGGGAGLQASGFEIIDTRLEPDLAIASCLVDDAFAMPGSIVKVTVRLENRGLAWTPRSRATDEPGACLRLVFVRADGTEDARASEPGIELAPGASADYRFTLEIPHDPVELRAEVAPNPIDMNPDNDSRTCFLGAPAPRDLECEVVPDGDTIASVAALGWSNPIDFDEIVVYRDGLRIASLPGRRTSFIDAEAPAGAHVYSLRSRVETSWSVRARCETELPPRDSRLLVPDIDIAACSTPETSFVTLETFEVAIGIDVTLRWDGFELVDVLPGPDVPSEALETFEVARAGAGEARVTLALDASGVLGPNASLRVLELVVEANEGAGAPLELCISEARLICPSSNGSTHAADVLLDCATVTPPETCSTPFIRGDATNDGGLDISDGIFTLSFLFLGQGEYACTDAADADDDNTISLTDAIYTFSFLFTGGSPPPSPYPECGTDVTGPPLGDCASTLCP